MMFYGHFFVLVKSLLLFCVVVVAMCDAVQYTETVFHLH